MATVTLPQGSYRGGVDGDVNYYHGIPYSQPFERFQSPKPVKKTDKPDDVIDTTAFGPICPQPPSRFEPYLYGSWPTPPNGGHPDESKCGVLSVYQPRAASDQDQRKLPVMVYMHGGAWQTGSSQINWYTGTALARDGQCIVVTINYRLGVLGYLYEEGKPLACGNEDHILAIEWVRDNITSFGGDPSNITAFGQSAGGYNTQLLLDLRPDLFRRAIIQSSPASVAFSVQDAKNVAGTVRSSLPSNKSLETASVDELLTAQAAAAKAHGSRPAQFMPVITDGVAPGGRHKIQDAESQKDVLVTWTQHDGSAFAALRQGPETTATDDLSRKLTEVMFKEPSIKLAGRLRQAGHNVTTLEHQWSPLGFALGATHCADLPLLLGDFESWKQSPMHGTESPEEWDRRGRLIRQAWGRFARDGTTPAGLEDVAINAHDS